MLVTVETPTMTDTSSSSDVINSRDASNSRNGSNSRSVRNSSDSNIRDILYIDASSSLDVSECVDIIINKPATNIRDTIKSRYARNSRKAKNSFAVGKSRNAGKAGTPATKVTPYSNINMTASNSRKRPAWIPATARRPARKWQRC
jgi:hypothetical protein